MDKHIKTPISILILFAFLISSVLGPCPAQADGSTGSPLILPKPGVMVRLSPPMNPPMLKGIKVHPDNPFRFDFILDKGDSVILNEVKDPNRDPSSLKSIPQDDNN